MTTTKRYTAERGADRWYIRDELSRVVDRRGKGWATKAEVLREIEYRGLNDVALQALYDREG